MIDIDIIKKRRGGTASTVSGSPTVVPGSTDYASESGHAETADRAGRADLSDNALHAQSSKELDSGSSVWQKLREMFGDLSDKYLRKDVDDTASGLITFLKGLKVGDGGKIEVGNYQAGVSGGVIENGANGSYMEVDRLLVRAKATFNDLEIAKIQYSYGQRVVGKGGVTITKVDKALDATGRSVYICHFNNKDGERYYHNPFIVGDQAIAQSWDDKDNNGTHRLWRLVTDAGEDYVTLSDKAGEYEAGSDAPRVGDDLCQLGYQGTDKANADRQSAIMESTIGGNAPYYTMLQGIKTFSLDGCDILTIGSKDGKGFLQVYGGTYIGDRDKKSYIRYDNESKELEIKAKLNATAGSDFTSAWLEKGEGNLIENSGFTGNYSSAAVDETTEVNADTVIYSDPWGSWTEHSGCTVSDDSESASGKSCTLASGTLKQTIGYPLLKGIYILTLKHKGGDLTVSLGGVTATVKGTEAYTRENVKIEVKDTTQNVLTISGSGTICELQLQAGNISSASWAPSEKDNNRYLGYYSSLQYLLDAIANGSTQTLGGLVLTQMLKVGNYRNGKMVQETGGMNGERNDDNSPFLWGGGTLKQAIATVSKYKNDPTYSPTEDELKDMANFVVTHGGRAILNDIIMRGYVYALGGIFKGDIDVKGKLKGATLESPILQWDEDSIQLNNGWLEFKGDLLSNYTFRLGDAYTRGWFGAYQRVTLVLNGGDATLYYGNRVSPSTAAFKLATASYNGSTYYQIPCYIANLYASASADVAGVPVDTVMLQDKANGSNYNYMLYMKSFQKVTVITVDNSHKSNFLFRNGSLQRLEGGLYFTVHQVPVDLITPQVVASVPGAGQMWSATYDNDWNS